MLIRSISVRCQRAWKDLRTGASTHAPSRAGAGGGTRPECGTPLSAGVNGLCHTTATACSWIQDKRRFRPFSRHPLRGNNAAGRKPARVSNGRIPSDHRGKAVRRLVKGANSPPGRHGCGPDRPLRAARDSNTGVRRRIRTPAAPRFSFFARALPYRSGQVRAGPEAGCPWCPPCVPSGPTRPPPQPSWFLRRTDEARGGACAGHDKARRSPIGRGHVCTIRDHVGGPR